MIDDEAQHHLVALVACLVAQAGNATVCLAARGAQVEHLDPAVQGIAGPHRREPAQFVNARRADARLQEHPALDEQPEAQRQGLEAAGDQAAIRRRRRRANVEVKGLRVVAPGKVDDLCLGQRQAIGGKYLAQCEVVEVAGRHVGDCTGFARGVALAIRRFDRAQGRRLPALSAHAAAVELSYPNLAQLLRRRGDVEIHRSQMHELFRRLVFNILIDNTDDHEKTHVLLISQTQQYVLAPARQQSE